MCIDIERERESQTVRLFMQGSARPSLTCGIAWGSVLAWTVSFCTHVSSLLVHERMHVH